LPLELTQADLKAFASERAVRGLVKLDVRVLGD